MIHKPYAAFVIRQFNGNGFDWDAVDLRATIHTSAYAPDLDAHDFFSDVTNELAAGDGYTPGGISLGARTVSFDVGTRQVRLLGGAQIEWDPITIDAGATNTAFRYIVVRNGTPGSPATDPLVSLIDFEADQTVDGVLSLAWDATGVGRLVLPV